MLDFRSDTVTKPTAAMMEAIANAEVGDAARGDDPTTNRLEALAAEMAGMEAAIFLPSGTMGNLVALLAHVRPGEEVIVEQTAHIYNSEVGSMSAVAGAVARAIAGENGVPTTAQVAAAIRSGEKENHAPTGLICLENTLNAAGGTVVSLGRMAELSEVAKAAGLPIHLDGARLFNAAAYLDCSIADICRFADTVMFSLAKSLGAPLGAMLLGSKDFIVRARKKSRMLGGGMRQTGLVAAAALVALEDPMPSLRRDHMMARMLGEGLAAIDESLVRLDTVQTNIVNCYLNRYPSRVDGFARTLKDHGVLANQTGSKVRFVTHRHIDEAAIKGCLSVMEQIIGAARQVA